MSESFINLLIDSILRNRIITIIFPFMFNIRFMVRITIGGEFYRGYCPYYGGRIEHNRGRIVSPHPKY